VVDSLKRVGDDGRVLDSVPREGLARVQTPQGFRFGALYKAHQAAIGQAFSDDAGVMQAAGHAVTTVAGAEEAFKVTDEADLARARAMAEARTWPDIRTGTGFDVHRLDPGDGVTLCGVFIPWDRKLIGHSDADVGWHALTDALLGAVAAGDIGSHFPPSEARWKGANSAIFLAEAVRIARLGGGRIVNVDVTLICERPKVGPHREVMRQRTADILGLEIDRVSIKATTTEQLGFTGRGEGIAAQAIASVAR
jgi:2-C-methyl-D-erythritol 4-phosphate cytidylyltransferase/2-C-methyl-D-erythritol 2,4-cyclodiphosphate synthase